MYIPYAFGFALLGLLDGVSAQNRGGNNANNRNNNGNNNANGNANAGGTNNAGGTTLDQSVIASNAASDGNPTDGQAASLTSTDNFINFCQGKTITNGLQTQGGSCNPITMGDMPAKANMISTIITNPTNNDNLQANTNFTVKISVSNLVAGSFTNPDNTYYGAPQQLQGGKVVGHAHVVIQPLNGQTPPDPTSFAFFKGINDAGDGKGNLQATVAGGLPAGNYRLCTMVSAANHQPVLMPIAQRGNQDDCVRFTVGGSGNGNNANANGNGNASPNANGNTNQNGNTNRGGNGNAQQSASASTTANTGANRGGNGNAQQSATASVNTNQSGSGGQNANGNGRGAATRSAQNGAGSATTSASAAAAATETNAANHDHNRNSNGGNANANAGNGATASANAEASATQSASSAAMMDTAAATANASSTSRGQGRGGHSGHMMGERYVVTDSEQGEDRYVARRFVS